MSFRDWSMDISWSPFIILSQVGLCTYHHSQETEQLPYHMCSSCGLFVTIPTFFSPILPSLHSLWQLVCQFSISISPFLSFWWCYISEMICKLLGSAFFFFFSLSIIPWIFLYPSYSQLLSLSVAHP